MRRLGSIWGLAVLLTAGGTAAHAQLLGGASPVGGIVGQVGDVARPITRDVADTVGRAGGMVSEVRARTIARLLRQHRDVIEADPAGQPVVRGEILALGADNAALARAQAAGFQLKAGEEADELGLGVRTLIAPKGMAVSEAVQRLRALDPQAQYEFNHLYQQGGAIGAGAAGAASRGPPGKGLRIGMVDGRAAQSRPALAGVRMVQKGFAPGAGQPSAHGTAVASLIAGAGIRSSAPGATLYIADVYGTGPTGGSAQAVVQGLGWLAQEGLPVINISLVGPQNLLLQAAVERLSARGVLLVAAVGNDGPAAKPLYPAAYPSVVAVTGVDARGRVLPEAGRGAHVDFAAIGAGRAAGVGGGSAGVRGTSFASPIVAGRLARLSQSPSPAGAAKALSILAASAKDLGAPGMDPVYGRGLIEP